MNYTIFYTGSASKKNPHNLVNYWNEPFTGTKKMARIRAREQKKIIKQQELVTGRIKVEILRNAR